MSTQTITMNITELEELPEDYDVCSEVEFEVDYDVTEDGIGSYEYWGSCGYDHGYLEVEITNVTWDKSLYTAEVNEIISENIDYRRLTELIDLSE